MQSSTAPEVKSVGKAQWSGRLGSVRRYVNFCGRAFAPLSSTGEVTDADAWRIALAHDDDAPRRVLRFLLGIRLGESRLVGGSGNPVSTAYVRNVRGYLSWMFASARVGLFDGAKLYSIAHRRARPTRPSRTAGSSWAAPPSMGV